MKSKLTWFQFHFKKFLLSYLFIHFFPPLGYFVFFSTFATFHDVSQRLYGCTSLIFLLFFFSAKFSFILIFLLLLLQSYFVRRCANWKIIFVFFYFFFNFWVVNFPEKSTFSWRTNYAIASIWSHFSYFSFSSGLLFIGLLNKIF